MIDPVINEFGNWFERDKYISYLYFYGNNTDPITNQPLSDKKNFVKCPRLRSFYEAYKAENSTDLEIEKKQEQLTELEYRFNFFKKQLDFNKNLQYNRNGHIEINLNETSVSKELNDKMKATLIN